MALSTSRRNTIRNALISLFNANPDAWSNGGTLTAAQWADQQLLILDAYRDQTRSREHYELRHRPWIAAHLGLSATIRTAIDAHCRGN